MLFNSLQFVAFFVLILIAYFSIGEWRLRKALLLIGSYVFYGAFYPPYVLLLAAATLFNYRAGLGMAAARSPARRRLWLLFGLVGSLGMLGFFKYAAFIDDSLAGLLGGFGVTYRAGPFWKGVVLPIGISYFTFQTLSYTIDVYRRAIPVEPSLLDFALFVAFFPQLVAGPIVRAREFLPQLHERLTGRFRLDQLAWGLHLVVFGLFFKMVLADYLLAPVVDRVYDAPDRASSAAAWIATFAFSGQIYFDFAGYSTCAIGIALCMGFALPDNFRRPYGAIGFRDFWRRWHISLSTWLRDYLYIPLGGGRGSRLQVLRSLMITMLLGGLWHGAAWTFVAWGALHGLALAAERVLSPVLAKIEGLGGRSARVIGAGLTFLLVTLAWVFFRAETFGDAATLLGSMLSLAGSGPVTPALRELFAALVMAGVVLFHIGTRELTIEEVWSRLPRTARILGLGLMLTLIASAREEQRAFIYFQF